MRPGGNPTTRPTHIATITDNRIMRYLAAIGRGHVFWRAAEAEVKPVIGVVPKGANHIFWQTVHAGALKAAKEYERRCRVECSDVGD